MTDTPFTAFAFAATGGSATRTMPARLADVVNVKEFRATGNGSTPDDVAIQAAIDYAATLGSTVGNGLKGGIVFFPPGNYVISAPLVNHNLSTSVQLIGSGRYNTRLEGTFSGFIIQQHNNYPIGIGAIRRMSVVNGHQTTGHDATTGAIQFNNSPCGTVEDCLIIGHTGIDATGNAFNTTVKGCNFTGCYVAGYFGQVGLYNSSAVGNTYGFLCYNTGFTAKGIRTESCVVGLSIGRNTTGARDVTQGVSISGYSTERCDTAIEVAEASGVHISGVTISGTIGTRKNTTAASWSSGTGKATITSETTLDSWGWTGSDTRSISIEADGTAANYKTSGYVTATRTGTNTFTYTIADPTTSVWNVDLTWSFKIQYGLRVGICHGLVVSGVVSGITDCEQAEIDLNYGGLMTGDRNVLMGVKTTAASGAGWLLPTTPEAKAAFKYINCDNPTPAFTFAHLPGETSVQTYPAVEGMEYDITDGQKSGTGTAVFGDIVVGGAAQHIKVRYNGTNWTRCG